MDTLHRGMPATEEGMLDMPALIRTLLEAALNEMMDERADMAREGGANSRNGYRERGLVTAWPGRRCSGGMVQAF